MEMLFLQDLIESCTCYEFIVKTHCNDKHTKQPATLNEIKTPYNLN